MLLHGGRGYNSFYPTPMERLADDRTVVRHDQLGAGKSDTTADLRVPLLYTVGETDEAGPEIVRGFLREADSLRR